MRDDITVDVAHVRGLTAYGPGWALMWTGRDLVVMPHETGDDGQLLEIVTYEGIGELRRGLVEEGKPYDDDHALADDLTDIASDHLASWDTVRWWMPMTLPYGEALAAHGFRRWGQGDGSAGPYFTQPYESPSGAREFRIGIPLLTDTPLIIERRVRNHRVPGGRVEGFHVITLPADTPPTDVAAVIAATARTAPDAPLRRTTDAPVTGPTPMPGTPTARS